MFGQARALHCRHVEVGTGALAPRAGGRAVRPHSAHPLTHIYAPTQHHHTTQPTCRRVFISMKKYSALSTSTMNSTVPALRYPTAARARCGVTPLWPGPLQGCLAARIHHGAARVGRVAVQRAALDRHSRGRGMGKRTPGLAWQARHHGPAQAAPPPPPVRALLPHPPWPPPPPTRRWSGGIRRRCRGRAPPQSPAVPRVGGAPQREGWEVVKLGVGGGQGAVRWSVVGRAAVPLHGRERGRHASRALREMLQPWRCRSRHVCGSERAQCGCRPAGLPFGGAAAPSSHARKGTRHRHASRQTLEPAGQSVAKRSDWLACWPGKCAKPAQRCINKT